MTLWLASQRGTQDRIRKRRDATRVRKASAKAHICSNNELGFCAKRNADCDRQRRNPLSLANQRWDDLLRLLHSGVAIMSDRLALVGVRADRESTDKRDMLECFTDQQHL